MEGSWMQARFWNKVGRKSLFLGPQSKPKTSKGNKASLSSIKEVLKYIAVTVRLSLKIWIIDHLDKRSAIAPHKKVFRPPSDGGLLIPQEAFVRFFVKRFVPFL